MHQIHVRCTSKAIIDSKVCTGLYLTASSRLLIWRAFALTPGKWCVLTSTRACPSSLTCTCKCQTQILSRTASFSAHRSYCTAVLLLLPCRCQHPPLNLTPHCENSRHCILSRTVFTLCSQVQSWVLTPIRQQNNWFPHDPSECTP